MTDVNLEHPLDFETPRLTIKRPALRCDQQGDTPDAERAARAMQAFMRDMTRSAATYMESCIHCGHCAEACHFYLTSFQIGVCRGSPLVR